MPAPQASMMQNLAKTNFRAKITLPKDWKQPSGKAAEHYGKAFKASEKFKAPKPMCLFKEASTNKYHVDTATDIGDKFEKFIDGICSAICSAWSQWQSLAMFAGSLHNATVVSILPGNLQGPPLFTLIFASAPKATPQELKYSKAIAQAVGTAWQTWQVGFLATLQCAPHAVFPGPMGPPTPTVPMPVATGSSPGEAGLSDSALKGMMVANLGDPQALHHQELFDAIAKAVKSCFDTWKTSTQMSNIMALGPIPTFAPPFVPCGPVVAGTNLPIPSVLV